MILVTLLNCPDLCSARNDRLVSEVGDTGTDREKVSRLVFDRGRIGEVKQMLGRLWRRRLSRLAGVRAIGAGGVAPPRINARGRGAVPKRNLNSFGNNTAANIAARPRRKGAYYAQGRWG